MKNKHELKEPILGQLQGLEEKNKHIMCMQINGAMPHKLFKF